MGNGSGTRAGGWGGGCNLPKGTRGGGWGGGCPAHGSTYVVHIVDWLCFYPELLRLFVHRASLWTRSHVSGWVGKRVREWVSG